MVYGGYKEGGKNITTRETGFFCFKRLKRVNKQNKYKAGKVWYMRKFPNDFPSSYQRERYVLVFVFSFVFMERK